MRILHLDEQRGWRGGEQQASYLARGLVERGHEVFLAGRGSAPFLTRDHGVPMRGVFPAPFLFEFDPWTGSQLAGIVDRYKIDIVHAHTSHTHGIACLIKGLSGTARIVVSRRVDFMPKGSLFNRSKYRRPDRIIAISQRIKDVLMEYGLTDDHVTVVHSGINPARVDVAPLSRESLGVEPDAYLIGNVAALVGHKDQRTLIAAMPAILQGCPKARLLIAGDGDLRAALEGQARSLNLGNAVRFLGYRDDVPAILKALDVFVMSSKEEGLGTSVLDAMAAGIPVVATAGGGIPEMVIHEETGILVPVGDSAGLAAGVLRVVEDRTLAEEVTRGATALLHAQFTVDRMVEGNLAVYEQLLAERR